MRLTCSLVACALLLGLGLDAQSRAPENDSITKADLIADLYFLASDDMQGRLVGTPGNRLAAEFIKSRFQRAGLLPAAGDSYFQHFNLSTASLGEANALTVTAGTGAVLERRPGQDYYPLRFSPSGRTSGGVVFAGFGIASPERQHDDYDDSVGGKIVLVLAHEPGERDPESPFDGAVTSEASRDLRKALDAQARGAAGILFVSDVHNHQGPANFEAEAAGYWPGRPPRIERYLLADWVERVHIPAANISPALAERLVAGTRQSLDALARASERPGGATPIALPGVEVELRVEVDRHILPERNVVAMVEGSDATLKDEWVIISAHYDHEGADDGRIFNGADDNGSGSVGLIEIAEAYARAAAAGQRPRRSVLFADWNAEERGLLGAWAYTESPLVPLDQTVAVLNMDMIGRNEEVRVGGGRRFTGLDLQTAEENATSVHVMGYSFSQDLAAAIRDANAEHGLRLEMDYDNNPSNLVRRSDQWPFLHHGVPAVFFHTGLHPDYHTPDDRPEKINYDKMETIARLVHEVSWRLANQDGRPALTARD
jgi:hypothetical protein